MTKPAKPVVKKRVSDKYYEGLRQRVIDVVMQINKGEVEAWTREVMMLVDAYLANRAMDPYSLSKHWNCVIIFLTLRADIARAMERSRKARARAKTRRIALEKRRAQAEKEAAQTVEQGVTAADGVGKKNSVAPGESRGRLPHRNSRFGMKMVPIPKHRPKKYQAIT